MVIPSPRATTHDLDALAEARVGAARIDFNGVIQYANQEVARLLRCSVADLVGRTLRDVHLPEDSDRVMRPFRRLRSGGPNFSKETRWVDARNEAVPLHQTYIRESPTDFLLVIHGNDFHEALNADEQAFRTNEETHVRHRLRQLEATIAELTEFNRKVAHDLRNPVRALKGFAALLGRDHALPRGASSLVASMKESADQAAYLIEGITRLSGTRHAPVVRKEIDLSALFRNTINRYRSQHRNRAAVITIQPGVVTNADEELTRVLVENIVANAWKFTRYKRTTRLSFKTVWRDGRTYFVLSDNGIGIAPQDAANIFKPFVRVHEDARFEGSGLGLAIVKEVATRHDGNVFAQGKAGEGAQIWFTLSRWQGWDRPGKSTARRAGRSR